MHVVGTIAIGQIDVCLVLMHDRYKRRSNIATSDILCKPHKCPADYRSDNSIPAKYIKQLEL